MAECRVPIHLGPSILDIFRSTSIGFLLQDVSSRARAAFGLLDEPFHAHRLQKIGGFHADPLRRELLRIPCGEDVRDIGPRDGPVAPDQHESRRLLRALDERGEHLLPRPARYAGDPVHEFDEIPAGESLEPPFRDVAEFHDAIQVHHGLEIHIALDIEDARIRPRPDAEEADGHTVIGDVEIGDKGLGLTIDLLPGKS